MLLNKKTDGNYGNFIISHSNRKAAEKCLSIAVQSGEKGQMLFVQGPSSSGKTHLMYSTATVFREKTKHEAIVVSQRQITDDYIQAIKSKNDNSFYEKYNCSLLLIDDVQDISGRAATQNEFVRILKKFIANGTDIILFSEYELNHYEEFEKGFSNCISSDVVDIHKADFLLRMRVLKKALKKENLKIQKTILWKIVLNKKTELASINGCVSKIKLMKTLKGTMPDKKEIIKILKEYEN